MFGYSGYGGIGALPPSARCVQFVYSVFVFSSQIFVFLVWLSFCSYFTGLAGVVVVSCPVR